MQGRRVMLSPISLAGAKQLLLAEYIPALFFGTAVLAHILAWAGLGLVAADLPSFAGGPGPALAAVHGLTLGVLLCTAIGASLQMLPVALGRPAPAERTCLTIFAALAAGAVLLIAGFASADATLLAAGALCLIVAVGLYVHAIACLLRGTKGTLRPVVLAAIVALTGAVVLAVILAGNYHLGFLPDHGALAAAHAILAGFGFMGLMVLGLSQILIPMFAVAEPPAEAPLRRAWHLAVAGLTVALAGLLADLQPLSAGGAGLGLVAAAQHVHTMQGVVAKRLRRRLGPEFVLIGASWVFLPLSLIAAGALSLDLLPAQGGALVVILALYGWLLSLLTGVLQRVLPFLASMQAARLQARPLAPGKLVDERGLKLHLYGHFAGLAALIVGTSVALPGLIVAGAAAGTIGALAFAWFAATVLHRTRNHLRAQSAGRTQPS